MSTLWPPAAATTRARFAASWPRTSDMSGPRNSIDGICPRRGRSGTTPSSSKRTASLKSARHTMSRSGTTSTSLRFSAGMAMRVSPASRRPIANAMAPRTGRILPSSPSSPMKTRSACSLVGKICSQASSTAKANGKSKPVPTLRRSLGARLAVMRRGGRRNPVWRRADKIRSRLSRTAPSGSPTMENAGRPLPASHSMRTGTAASPTRVADRRWAIMPRSLPNPVASCARWRSPIGPPASAGAASSWLGRCRSRRWERALEVRGGRARPGCRPDRFRPRSARTRCWVGRGRGRCGHRIP